MHTRATLNHEPLELVVELRGAGRNRGALQNIGHAQLTDLGLRFGVDHLHRGSGSEFLALDEGPCHLDSAQVIGLIVLLFGHFDGVVGLIIGIILRPCPNGHQAADTQGQQELGKRSQRSFLVSHFSISCRIPDEFSTLPPGFTKARFFS